MTRLSGRSILREGWALAAALGRAALMPLGAAVRGAAGSLAERMCAAASRRRPGGRASLYRSIYENAQEGIYLSTLDGRILEANPAMARSFGYDSPKEFIAATPDASTLYADPSDRARFVEELKARGPLQDYLTSFRRRDGVVLWFSVSARLVPDDQGSLTRIFGMILDVTERKRQQDELRRSRDELVAKQEKLNLALDITDMAVWGFDPSTGLFHFDDRFFKLFATTAEREGGSLMTPQIYGSRFLPPDEVHLLEEAVAGVMSERPGGRSRSVEHRIIRRDGEVRNVSVRFREIPDERGKLQRVIGTIQDITGLKRVEEELRQGRDQLADNQRKLDLAMDFTQVAFWEYDTQEDQYHFNDRFYALLATSAEREGGEYMSSEAYINAFLTPEAARHVREAIASNRFLPDGALLGPMEHHVIRRDGVRRIMAFLVRVSHDPGDGIIRIIGTMQDITQLKQAEEELRQSRDQLAAQQEKLELALDLAKMAAWEYSPITGLYQFNDRFYSLFATTVEREGGYFMTPKTYAGEFLPPEEAHLVEAGIELAKASPPGTVHPPVEHDIIRRDGARRTVAVRVTEIAVPGGAGYRAIGTIQDITELKLAEEELRRSRDQLAANQHKLAMVMGMASLCSWEYDFVSKTYTVDDHFFALHGTSFEREGRYVLPEEEVLSRFFHKDDVAWIRDQHAKILPPGGPETLGPHEYHSRTASGRALVELAQALVIRDEQGYAIRMIGAAQDVTERHLAEEALRQSEASLARAQRIGNMGNWDYDTETGALRWSAQMYRIYGVSPRDFVPTRETVLELIHPEARETVLEAVGKAAAENLPVRYSHRIVLPGGGTREVEVQLEPIRSDDGVVRRLIGTTQDITERKMAEDALRQSETRYRGLVESIPLGVAVISPQMRVLSLNARMRQWNPEVDVFRHPICHRAFNYPPSEEPCPYCPVTKALADGNIHESVTATPTKDGIRSYRIIACPVLEAGGRVTSVIEIVEDVTEKAAAEEAIRRSERKYRNLLDNLPLNVIYKDRDSTYLTVNAYYSRRHGLEPDQLAGMTDYKLFPPELAGKYRADDQRIMAAGLPEEYDEPYILPGGEERIVHTLKTPLRDESGSVESILILFWDVTQARRSEAVLRESEKMAAVGELASGVAHDFNNILGSIANLSLLVMGDLPRESEARGDLETILASADMGKELVRQLLAFCKTGKQTRTVFDPAETTLKALTVFKPSIPDDVEVREDIHPGVGLIHADASQFRQVVLNLCSNAVDAMRGRSGRPRLLGVSLSRESVSLENRPHAALQPGEYVVLRVADTGAGMEPAVAARIFEPFFTTKPQGRGTGLGLAVVHGVATRHGGAVSVRSTPGKGSVFSVHFPAYEPESRFAIPQAGPSEA